MYSQLEATYKVWLLCPKLYSYCILSNPRLHIFEHYLILYVLDNPIGVINIMEFCIFYCISIGCTNLNNFLNKGVQIIEDPLHLKY